MTKLVKSFDFSDVSIAGISTFVSGSKIKNAYFENTFTPKEIASVQKHSGVEQRYFVDQGETTENLCYSSASILLNSLGWDPVTIDGLIFLTQTPTRKLPASSCTLQSRLGLPTNSFAFDVNLGCSAYPYGLWLASSLISSGAKRILVLAGETTTSIVNPSDRATSMLFGDAGSATAVEYKLDSSLSSYTLGTNGLGADAIMAKFPQQLFDSSPFVTMNGSKVFEFTLSKVPELISYLKSRSTESIDFFCLHQANKFMLEMIRKKSGLEPGVLPMNIAKFGNTSSASIPLLITDVVKAEINSSTLTLALIGFGVGLSWSTGLVSLSPDCILLHTDQAC
ncbi:ketoacyl-ACP synthase III [bacterium]|nr:ketoacyl-ACP synthase III [bacterium]